MKLLAVNFHYFREETYSGGIYPVSKAKLNSQINELAKYYTFISQDELAAIISNKSYSNQNYCVLTIDDGLKEQMEAFNFLREKGIPSILYVPTNPIKNKQVLNVHKLHYVRSKMTDEDLFDILDEKYVISKVNFDDAALANQYRYDGEISRKVKFFLNFILSEERKEEAINYFFSSLVSDEEAFATQLYMSQDNLKTLAHYGALGSHGAAHIPLATKSLKEARTDVDSSLNYLEAITGKPVVSFSYPYGGKNAVNTDLGSVFSNTSIQFAFTMWRGVNSKENLVSPLFLQRVDTNDAPGGKNNSKEYILSEAFA